MLQETPPAYPTPAVTVDVVLFTLSGRQLFVLLPWRRRAPYSGVRALPGGYVHPQVDVDLSDAARRVLVEKAGLETGYFLEQLGTFSGPSRDPRGWSVSVAYYAVVPFEKVPADVLPSFCPVDSIGMLPFDHAQIVASALARLRGKATYSSLPAFLLPDEFTFRDLQEVYESVMGTPIDGASFRRKIDDLNLVEPVPGAFRRGGRGRSAQLYRLAAPALQQFSRTLSPMLGA